MLKIRRPLGRLIFNMGIAIPGKTVFLIETAPRQQPRSFGNTLRPDDTEIEINEHLLQWTAWGTFWNCICKYCSRGFNKSDYLKPNFTLYVTATRGRPLLNTPNCAHVLLKKSALFCITLTSHECYGVPNHRQHHCLFNNLFRLAPTKTLKHHITRPFVRKIHRTIK